MAGTKSLGTGNTKCFTIFLGMSLHREPKGNEKHPSRQPLGTFWRRRKQKVHAKITLDIWAETLHLCNGSGNARLSEQACPTCTLNASQNSWEDVNTSADDSIVSKCQRWHAPSRECLWLCARVCMWLCRTECACQPLWGGELNPAYLGGDAR